MSVIVNDSQQQFRIKKISDAIKAIDISQSTAQAATVARKFIVDQAKGHLNLPQEYVDKLFTLQTGFRAGEYFTSVVGRARSVQLRNFPNVQVTKTGKGGKAVNAGIVVKVLRASSRELLPGAFYFRLKSGNVEGGNGFAIAIRAKRGPGSGKGEPRVLYGPAPYTVMARVSEQALEVGGAVLVEQLQEQARRVAYSGDY